MKCEECGSTDFISIEKWQFPKRVYINAESGIVREDFDESEAEYRDDGPWECQNGHRVRSYELQDKLYQIYEGYFG